MSDAAAPDSPDVIFVTDTQLSGHAKLRTIADKMNFSFLHVNRPKSMQRVRARSEDTGADVWLKSPPSGGIVVLILNRSIKCRIIAFESAGAVAVRLWRKGHAPLAAICAYVPPSCSSMRSYRARIFSFIERQFVGLSRVFSRVLICGDLNTRIPSFISPCKYYTQDVLAKWSVAARGFRKMMQRLHISPVAGRRRSAPAPFTSRSIVGSAAGKAVVDYWLADCNVTNDIKLLPSPYSLEVLEHCSHFLTHTMQSISVRMLPEAGPQIRRVKRGPRFKIPAYGSDAWTGGVHELLETRLRHCGDIARDPGAPFELVMDLFADSLVHVLEEVQWAEDRSLPPPPPPPPPDHGSFGSMAPHRGFLPDDVAAVADERRRVASRAKHSPFDWLESKARIRQLTRTMQHHMRAHERTWKASAIERIRKLRYTDAHSCFKVVKYLCPEDPLVQDLESVIPSESGHPEAFDRFLAHWTELSGTAQSDPPVDLMHLRSHWFQFVKQVDCAGLDRDIAWDEVYHALFPAHQSVHPRCPNSDCKLCAMEASQRDDWDPHDLTTSTAAPSPSPSLHTSTSPGIDNLPAECLRWPRPDSEDLRHPYRVSVTQNLAAIYNRVLAEGRVPTDWHIGFVVPLFKGFKAGTTANAANPSDYRGITIGSVLGKLLSIILLRRMQHHLLAKGFFGPEQIGFFNKRGAEHHVFTLLETLRVRKQRGLRTAALFVDLKKAYDMVNIDALLATLTHIGIPPRLVELFRHWNAGRAAVLSVNGDVSSPYPVRRGVPQGDCLSCLFFNIYIESLAAYLRSLPQLPGVSVAGATVRFMLYADDLVILAESRDELQFALGRAAEWAKAWGMQISTGEGKTEAVVFNNDCKNGAPIDTSTPLAAAGLSVRWALKYRYLGYIVHGDLRPDGTVLARRRRIEGNIKRFFQYNPVIRGLPSESQLQLLKALVISSNNYLSSLMPPGNLLEADKLDSPVRLAIQHILHIPKNAPWATTSAISSIQPTVAIWARERLRLFLQLRDSPFQSDLAVSVFNAIQADSSVRYGKSISCRSWVRETERYLVKVQKDFNLSPDWASPASVAYHAIARHAHVFGRLIGFSEWQRESLKRSGSSNRPTIASMIHPDTTLPSSFVRDALCSFRLNPSSALGTGVGHTPVGVIGPGCSGSLFALSTMHPAQFSQVVALWLGPQAFSLPRMSATSRGASALGVSDRFAVANAASQKRWRWWKLCAQCPLCDSSSRLDPQHLINECMNPAMLTWRANAQQQASLTLTSLVQRLSNLPNSLRPAAASLNFALASIPSIQWASPVGRFTLLRVVMAQPWIHMGLRGNPWYAADQSSDAADALGALFGLVNLKHRFLRGFTDAWLRLSIRLTAELNLARMRAAPQSAAGDSPDSGSEGGASPLAN